MITEIDKQIALEYLASRKIELAKDDLVLLDYYTFALDAYREGQFAYDRTIDQIVYYFRLQNLNAFSLSNLRRMNLI